MGVARHQTWATNGGIANVHIAVASVYPELRTRGQATFVIPPDTKVWCRARNSAARDPRFPHRQGVLDDVRLPEDFVPGGREKFEARIARVSGASAGGRRR